MARDLSGRASQRAGERAGGGWEGGAAGARAPNRPTDPPGGFLSRRGALPFSDFGYPTKNKKSLLEATFLVRGRSLAFFPGWEDRDPRRPRSPRGWREEPRRAVWSERGGAAPLRRRPEAVFRAAFRRGLEGPPVLPGGRGVAFEAIRARWGGQRRRIPPCG